MRTALRSCLRWLDGAWRPNRSIHDGGRVLSLLAVLALLSLSFAAASSQAAATSTGQQEAEAPGTELEEGEPPGEQEAPPTEAERQNPNEPVTTLHEIPSLRTENAQTFLLSDGAYSQRIADHPINFRAGDGSWQPIEDQLVQQDDGSWQPQASPTPISLPASLGSGSVSIGSGDQQLSFALEGASQDEGDPGGASRVYRDALPETDVTYALTPQALRETLTLKSASAPTTYRYHLNLAPGLHASQQDDGTVLVEDAQGQTIYTLTPPSASDSNPERPFPSKDPVSYELSDDGTTLSLSIDKGWLEDPQRVFPVKIDPEAWLTTSKDCPIISAGYANKAECGNPLFVGPSYPKVSEGIGRSLLYFDTSCIPKGSAIGSSSLHLYFAYEHGSSTITMEAHALEKNAEEKPFTSAVTWNKYDGTHAWGKPGGDFQKAAAGERVVKPSEAGKELQIGFTPQVEQWVRDPTSNYGILLKAQNETVAGYDEFAQSGNPSHEPEPILEVIYEPRLGIPPMGQVYQQPLGFGASMSVNVANGNLYLDSPDVNYATEGYGTELGRTYNSQDDLLDGASVGNWRLTKGDDTKFYGNEWDGAVGFHSPDGDGTRFDRAPWADNHPAAGDKAFTGEAGFNEGLIQHEGGTRTLTFPDGTEWKTNNEHWSIPTEIVDPGGETNTITLTYKYESGVGRLEALKDTHGHTLTLTREASSHRVTKIEPNKGKDWKYAYKEGRLITVTYPAGGKAKYTYYKASGLLETIDDPSGTWVVSYDEQSRVASLRRLVNGTVKKAGSEDEMTTFSYETEQTTVTNPEGGKPVYYYDEFGNVLEEPATQEAAAEFYAGYAEIEPEAARKDIDLQDHASILDSQLSAQLGGSYTGEWFDPTSKHVKIGITSEGYEKTVEQDLDNLGLADNADLVTTAHGMGQLEEGQESLRTALATLESEGLITTGIDPETDKLTVSEGTSLTSTQRHEVEVAVGASAVPVTVTTLTTATARKPFDVCARGSCSAPLRGGVRIRSKSAECTLGYDAKSAYNPLVRYAVTAGHCLYYGGGIGESWTVKRAKAGESETEAIGAKGKGFQEFGKSSAYIFGQHQLGITTTARGDMGLIDISPPITEGEESNWYNELAPRIIVYGRSELEPFGVTRNELYLISKTHYSEKESRLGFVVCMSGVDASGPHEVAACGKETGLEDNPGKDATVHNVENIDVCGLTGHTTQVTGGASGSPVFKNGEAFGVLSSGGECDLQYEGINRIEQDMHIHIYKALG